MAIKKDEPYTASAIENGASQYSKACRDVKYKPNNTVNTSPWVVLVELFTNRAWWAHVTVIPDEIRIIVLRRGIWKGLNGWIPLGGQINPISIEGANLLWKNAQKKEIKKKTSEVINKIIPQRNPMETESECLPWKVPSRVISRHHWYIVIIVIKIPKSKR